MIDEIWIPIKGFEEYYHVSNLGNIRALEKTVPYKDGRIRRYKSIILKPRIDGRGYYFVTLYKPSYKIQLRVHRLIAVAFIPNPENKPEVNHKDGVKTNNEISNLEWSTRSENTQHAHDIGLLKQPAAKLTADYVNNIRVEYANGDTQFHLADKYKISQTQVSRIVNNKNW